MFSVPHKTANSDIRGTIVRVSVFLVARFMFLCPILATSDPYAALQKICADIPGVGEGGEGDWKAQDGLSPGSLGFGMFLLLLLWGWGGGERGQ